MSYVECPPDPTPGISICLKALGLPADQNHCTPKAGFVIAAKTAHPTKHDIITFNSAIVDNTAFWTVQAFEPYNDVHDLFHREVVLMVLACVCATRHLCVPTVTGIPNVLERNAVADEPDSLALLLCALDPCGEMAPARVG